ncbi:MAG: hypothetical protein A2340_13425 [Lentisphaerae bacterium RIFOXYB12_FULL_60_10]|nr:MAG: hypothetical protein A2340_13425 [Lentisphaerae bacterium RIFOXYB12_FULL_60_10]
MEWVPPDKDTLNTRRPWKHTAAGPGRNIMIFRIIAYTLIILFAWWGERHGATTGGIVAGAIYADLLTWGFDTVREFFSNLTESIVSSIVNLVSLYVVFQVIGIETPDLSEPERLVGFYLTFILVFSFKGFCRLYEWFMGGLS